MNDEALHCMSIPVLMLMIQNLEFHRKEYARDRVSTGNLDEWIRQCKVVLEEKQVG